MVTVGVVSFDRHQFPRNQKLLAMGSFKKIPSIRLYSFKPLWYGIQVTIVKST